MTFTEIINGVVMLIILLAVTLFCVWWMFRGPE